MTWKNLLGRCGNTLLFDVQAESSPLSWNSIPPVQERLEVYGPLEQKRRYMVYLGFVQDR